MAVVLGDLLRRLCVEVGWSYAVFWRAVGLQERRCLVWEDGYYKRMPGGLSGFEAMDLLIKEKGLLRCSRGEERLAELGCSTRERLFTLVHKRMAAQVHVVGDGIVGEAASTGRHQWVLHDNLDKKLSGSMDLVELNHQFLEGIRTIAVIPVLPQGVLQLGSTQQILEDIGFVNHVQHLFMHLGSVTGAHLSDVSGNVLNHNKIEVSAGMQPSVNQYGDVGNSIIGLPCLNYIRDHQLFRCHDNRFITRDLPSFPSSCNKVPAHSQLLLDYEISRQRMLPFSNFPQSTCHLVKPNLYQNNQLKSEYVGHSDTHSVPDSGIIEKTFLHHSNCQPEGRNDSLSPGHLNFLEKQFSVYHETTNESADGHEIMLDSSKLINLRSHEHELSNSLKDYGAISSLGGSGSLSKTNFENTSLLSSGTLECVKPHVSSNSEVSGMLSPAAHSKSIQILAGGSNMSHSTSIGKKSLIISSLGKENNGNELCQALDGPTETDDCGSGDRLQHSTCQGGWWCDSSLIPENKQHGDGTCAVAYSQNVEIAHKSEILPDLSTKISIPKQKSSDRNLFDMFGLDQISRSNYTTLDDSFASLNVGASKLITDIPSCIAQLDADTSGDILDDEISCSGLFSETGSDQLLDAIVSQIKPSGKIISDDNISRNTTATKTSDILLHNNVAQCDLVALAEKFCRKSVGQSSVIFESQTAGANSMNSECSMGRSEGPSPKDEKYRSQISLWVGKAQNMNGDQMSATNCKRVGEVGKLNRKRVRPGENPRPRPKDRQMIQDRVKELREIIPNGAKLSIDALLEKTIKHMLFLQSVAKHADKLKETGKPKIISKDEGLLLKNFEGGATWAFEVGSRSLICPIIVEDLSTPRHMLVEMLCEKRGLFLEIADLIRGLGLTILKGVMEARDDKVWARFAVEAIRDITRMEVFLSLVPLLEPTAGNIALECIPNFKKPYNAFHHSSISATGAAACP